MRRFSLVFHVITYKVYLNDSICTNTADKLPGTQKYSFPLKAVDEIIYQPTWQFTSLGTGKAIISEFKFTFVFITDIEKQNLNLRCYRRDREETERRYWGGIIR